MKIKRKVTKEISVDKDNKRLCGLDCPHLTIIQHFKEYRPILSCYLFNKDDAIMTSDKAILRCQECLDSEIEKNADTTY